MKTSPDLPDLRIAPVDHLHSHEAPDEQRADPLVKALRRDGILKNPPIVLPIGSRPGHHVVLDGANRVQALGLLDVADCVVQVVHPDGDELRVETWNHILLGNDAQDLLGRLSEESGLALSASDAGHAVVDLEFGKSLAALVTPAGKVFEVKGEENGLEARLTALNHLVDWYARHLQFERTSASAVEPLMKVYEDLACLVIFPRFEVQEVVHGAAQGWHFPPGITRFVVSPRALRVNYPIERLKSEAALIEKQRELDAWVRQRVRERRVRYYAESTFLFDE